MLIVAVLSSLAGGALGLVTKVHALILAAGCCILGVPVLGSFQSASWVSVATATLITVVGLQIGYVGGLTTRQARVLARARRTRAPVAGANPNPLA